MAVAKKTDDPVEPDAVQDRVFKKPAATIKAEQKARETAEEVREMQKEARLESFASAHATPVETAYASVTGPDDPESFSLSIDGTSVTMVVTALKTTYKREDALAAFRAWSKSVSSL